MGDFKTSPSVPQRRTANSAILLASLAALLVAGLWARLAARSPRGESPAAAGASLTQASLAAEPAPPPPVPLREKRAAPLHVKQGETLATLAEESIETSEPSYRWRLYREGSLVDRSEDASLPGKQGWSIRCNVLDRVVISVPPRVSPGLYQVQYIHHDLRLHVAFHVTGSSGKP